jgi:hypothetical protein
LLRASFVCLVAILIIFIPSQPLAASDDPSVTDLALARKFLNRGDDRGAIRALDRAFLSIAHSSESDYSKQLDQAGILAAEIDPLRRIGNLVRLKHVLTSFANMADEQSQPMASALPPMSAHSERFKVEEALFNATLSQDWLLTEDITVEISKALGYAAAGRFADALLLLPKGHKDGQEFIWYYRAWVLLADHRRTEAINTFFCVLRDHQALPNGHYFSIQVSSADYLGHLPARDLSASTNPPVSR